jgi:choline-glycine betaine transporter
MTVLVMVLVAIFFVSGADAASIVMGSLSERGTIEPTRRVVVFWGVVMGAVAAIMLLVGGDEALTGLQNLTIIAALPFALVMVGMAVSLAKDVRSDPLVLRRSVAAEAVEQAVVDGITRHGEDFQLVVQPTAVEPNQVQPLPEQDRVQVGDDVPAGRPQDPRD